MKLVEKNKLQSKDITENVPHSYLYHAEIMYETGDSFGFIDAMGNTLEEFIDDINSRFNKYKDRQPHLAEAISDPNGEKIDITYKIRTILKKRGIA